MPVKIKEEEIFVKSLEKGKDKSLKVILESSRFGESFIEVNEEDFQLFFPGRKYKGLYNVEGVPDFCGEKDVWRNVCTISYSLEKILDETGKIIYKRE